MMPTLLFPPKFMNVTLLIDIMDVLRPLPVEDICSRCNSHCQRRAGSFGQVVMVPTVIVPPEFVNMTGVPAFLSNEDDVLSAFSREYISGWTVCPALGRKDRGPSAFS